MESSVSLETLPPEDSDLYIPNLSSVQTQNTTSLPGENLLQSMQIPAIRYPPTVPVVSPAAATATAIPPTLVAAPAGSGSLIHGIYRTTLTTQVIAAQAFHYPPTPPIDGSMEVLDKRRLQPAEPLALTPASQSFMENEVPASVGYDKPINPFPSLPTPPDVEVQHTPISQAMTQHQQQCANGEELQTSIGKMSISHQWAAAAAAQQTANISYFMPQASVSPGGQLMTYSNTTGAGLGLTARRGCPPATVPALHQMYSASLTNSSMPLSSESSTTINNVASMVGDVLKKMPAVPALVKDDVRTLAPHEYVYCMDPGTMCGSVSPSGVGYTNKHCSNCSVTVTPLWRRNPDGKYVCNACGLYYRINGTHRNGTQKKKQKTNLKCMNNKCSNCGTTKTVLWRRMENGDPVCNPCGLYYKLNGYSRPLTLVKETIQTRNRKSTGKSKKKGKKSLSSHLPLTPPLSAGLATEGSTGNIFSGQLSPGNYILAPPSTNYEQPQQPPTRYGEFNYTPISFPSANGYNHSQQHHLYGKHERSAYVCEEDTYGAEDMDDMKPNISTTTTAFNVIAASPCYSAHTNNHNFTVGRMDGTVGMDTSMTASGTFQASTFSAFSPFASSHNSPIGQPDQTSTHSPLL